MRTADQLRTGRVAFHGSMRPVCIWEGRFLTLGSPLVSPASTGCGPTHGAAALSRRRPPPFQPGPAGTIFYAKHFRSMQRYYFDMRDGNDILPDDEGLELGSLEAVQEEAARSLADMARDAIRKHKGTESHREIAIDPAQAADVGCQVRWPLRQAGLCLFARGGRLSLSSRGATAISLYERGGWQAATALLDDSLSRLCA